MTWLKYINNNGNFGWLDLSKIIHIWADEETYTITFDSEQGRYIKIHIDEECDIEYCIDDILNHTTGMYDFTIYQEELLENEKHN